jgi:hypothetical protein
MLVGSRVALVLAVAGLVAGPGDPAVAPYSATRWVTTAPERLRLAAREARALVFVAPAVDRQASIRINRAVGIPMDVQAPGPVDRSVALTGFEAPGFATGGPIRFSAGGGRGRR